MIEEQSGKHFDPAIVDAFRANYAEFVRVREIGADPREPALTEGLAGAPA